MSVYIARITRQVGEEIVKDEISDDDVEDLLLDLFSNFSHYNILEIHITRGEK